jgi:hydroxymethylglutaryl-CoA reductase (NADPH)
MNLRDFKSVGERRKALEREVQVGLDAFGDPYGDEEVASTRHCENMIGTVRVPVGVAGPLSLIQDHTGGQKSLYYVPLATSEGALVASVSRGVKAIFESGGVSVSVTKVGSSRGPSFVTPSLKDNLALGEFLRHEFVKLQEVAQTTSRHLSLVAYHTTILGRRRFVRFSFDTQEAMGMNMATIATQKLAEYIETHTKAKLESLSANFCTDKKSNWQSVVLGRGYVVDVEVVVPQAVLIQILKTDATSFYTSWLAKTQGSMLSGAIGNNAQAANVVAALFLATGQDLGHVGEGSQVFTTTELNNDPKGGGIVFSAHLPDVMVGVVGGGTNLSPQKQALSLLGIKGQKDEGATFAAIVGASVVAGELSLLASLAEGSLVRAHETLARGKKGDTL